MAVEQKVDEQEIALVTQAQAGNNDALGQIFQNYSPSVTRRAASHYIPGMEPSDIKQEFGLKLAQGAIRSYSPYQGRLSAWINSVTNHLIIDKQRQAMTRPQMDPANFFSSSGTAIEEQILSETPPLEEQAYENERASRVRNALSQLPFPQREVLYLAYFEGLSHSEIAQRTGDPLGTVKTRIKLGVSKMRHSLLKSGFRETAA